jgi:formate C-acetyltransferase
MNILTKAWFGFKEGIWMQTVDVRDFIQNNYRPYDGDEGFLSDPTPLTRSLWADCERLLCAEQARGGVLDVDTVTVTGVDTHQPGYINRHKELVFGLQTNAPLKRAINPYGGIRMTEQACRAYGYEVDPHVRSTFNHYRRTHNEGVFAVYSPEILKLRKVGLITGLPDAYGRGRIIGDYRRVPLYGVDYLIQQKETDLADCNDGAMTEDIIRYREEIHDQIEALNALKRMAAGYGFDISIPAVSAREAIQWLYFAYLGAVKEQNGAAMSFGRTSTFLDIYIQRDIDSGYLDETAAQELIDQLVIKLRLVRQLRTPDYNELFAGDPVWITEAIGGIGLDGRPLVTPTSYRFLHTLTNLGPAPEPNLTVLWSDQLPNTFKAYCARVTMKTSAIQYESDDLMRPEFGDDYGIACCVSAMKLGKQMQFFGARCNLAKLLLVAINGGRDELTGEQIGPQMPVMNDNYLNYKDVSERFQFYMDWICKTYVNTMNIIHYMHDKYAYESLQMALHDSQISRFMAFGIAGLSVTTDSLSAIKFASVKPVLNPEGLIVEYEVHGDYPRFGNDDDQVDQIACNLVSYFESQLHVHAIYRKARPTLSVLTITSNVVYGQKTGSTPDGRKRGEPFAPGANPMHGRDRQGALASLNSMAKLPYKHCLDGISCTFSIVPAALGRTQSEQVNNLTSVLSGFFSQKAHHLNVNVLDKTTLLHAMDHPEAHPQLTIRVSGYAVHFHKLSRQQQQEVIARTFHSSIS